jgi:pimeloyl-ACP methyl ester carboxylesterase
VAEDHVVRATTRSVAAAFLGILAILASVGPAAARAGGGITWRPCPDDTTAQCSTLSVPIDWADPASARIGVAVARRTATDPAHRIGTLVVNPGGPGESGVDFALATEFSAGLRSRFDIIGFDPRGVGRSHPVICSRALVAAAPSPLITSRQQYDAMVAYNRRLTADCRARTGPLYDHVDTLSVVRDTDALRSALGEERISFYGASYGTVLGTQYAGRFPARARAVVLDSVLDHGAGVDDFLGTGADAAQDAFDQFVAWCARDRTCALHGRDVRALWSDLLARAAAGTLRDPFAPGRPVSVFGLLGVAFNSFYAPQWYSLAYYMSQVAPAERAAADPQAPQMFPAIMCADWSLPIRGYADLAGRLRALRTRAPQMLASPLTLTATVGCLGRSAPAVNPQRPLGPATSPVLVVGTRHDPATAYRWARRVATRLGPAARLVTYRGSGHIAYGRSACVTGLVDRFLLSGRTPAAGAACPAVPPSSSGVGTEMAARVVPDRHAE